MDSFPIDPKTIERVTKLIPEEDLVSASRDRETASRGSNLLLILSTPRSGSTLLSDMVDRIGLCCPAEYYQPYDYLPLLASRWDCVRNGVLEDAAYARQLRRYRTSERGWLGIKLHPTHVPLFQRAHEQFREMRWHGVHLVRRDHIAQAISFHIADQTQKWSSHFQSTGEATYDYRAIRHRLHQIIEGNAFLLAVAATYDLNVETIYYEDLIENPSHQLARIPGIEQPPHTRHETGLEKQGCPRNQEWAKRFAREYKAERLATYEKEALSKVSVRRRLLERLF